MSDPIFLPLNECVFAGQYASCAAAPEVLGFGDDLSQPTNPFTYHGLILLAEPSTIGTAQFSKTTNPLYTSSVADGNNNTVPTAIVGNLAVNTDQDAIVAEQVVIKDSSSMVGGTFVAVSAYLYAVEDRFGDNLAIEITGSSNGSTNSNCQQIVPGLGGPALVNFGGNQENQPSNNCVVDTLLFTSQTAIQGAFCYNTDH
jgi:hypothetical protein